MKVCIGITTKNRKSILPKAVESALRQNYANKEVLVFDDGSTDGTIELQEKYPGVRWERSEHSLGLLEARNRMMRTSDADIFVSLDDDAWFLKDDEIEVAVAYFKEQASLAAIAFDILERDSDRFLEVTREESIPTNLFIGAGHALRLSAVREVGYYVPFPVKYGHEEKDLAIRLLDSGYSIRFLPGVHIWHDFTLIARNGAEQDQAFMINDLIFKYRRVPFIYILPVLAKNVWRTMLNRVRKDGDGKKATFVFFKLLPSQSKFVRRVKISTYQKYRNLSKSYIAYRAAKNQNQNQN